MQNNKKRGLGKGISSLLGDYSYSFGKSEPSGIENRILELEIGKLQPNPNQPRKNFDRDSLEALAASIKANGIIQPIVAEKVTDDKYSIIAGERRYRAARIAGLQTVPVLLMTCDEERRMELSLVENIQREELNPVEEAKAYKYLMVEKDLTQEELSRRVGKSRSAIANSVRMLQLPPAMLDALESRRLTSGHARALLSVANPADCEILFGRILKEGLSVRQAEELAAQLNKGKRIVSDSQSPDRNAGRPAEVLEIEERFLSVVGTKVRLKGKPGKGALEIPFSSADELERLYRLFDPKGSLFGDGDEEF